MGASFKVGMLAEWLGNARSFQIILVYTSKKSISLAVLQNNKTGF